jgi:hypothetical protein
LDPLRNKITFSESHLLQRLIYVESEPFERHKEQAGTGALGKEDLLIHFIKHIVRITLRRNSFYVTLGMSRLLHNYTTAETMGIYNVVVQDPERVKDDYYYRSRKGVLMQELLDRFGEFIKICQRQRGEERFEAEPNPGKLTELVRECLLLFTPWATTCSVPASFDPITTGVATLANNNQNNEDTIELNRIHAVLHPDCYQRLTIALGLESPEHRLEVPHFYLASENRNGGETVRTPTVGLDNEDLIALKNDLDGLAERRKKAASGILQVLVDGKEYARLDLARSRNVRLNLEDWKDLIEIWTTDKKGDLLLATHLLTFQEQGTKSSIVLEGGQKLSVSISRSADAQGPTIEIGYRETNPIKAAALGLRQVPGSSAFSRWLFEGSRSRVLLPVSALILLLVLTGVVVTYLQREKNSIDSRTAANGNESQPLPLGPDTGSKVGSGISDKTPASQQDQVLSPDQADSRSEAQRKPNSSNPESANTASRSTESPSSATDSVSTGEEKTRAIGGSELPVSLVEVKRVFVESIGDKDSDQALRGVLIRTLQENDRLIVSSSRENAHAILRLRTRQLSGAANEPQSTTFVNAVQLINARGEVIWPIKGRRMQRTYSGRIEIVGTKIVQDLFADIDYLKRRP